MKWNDEKGENFNKNGTKNVYDDDFSANKFKGNKKVRTIDVDD